MNTSLPVLDIFRGIPEKSADQMTTSRKFKQDLLEFLLTHDPAQLTTALEIGGYLGYTTRILSFAFGTVTSIESPQNNDIIQRAQALNADRSNIVNLPLDSYTQPWPSTKVDLVLIDADHHYDKVRSDIANAKKVLNPGGYIVLDDYGYPMDQFGVRRAVQNSGLKVIQRIGERFAWSGRGFTVDPKALHEGVICQIPVK